MSNIRAYLAVTGAAGALVAGAVVAFIALAATLTISTAATEEQERIVENAGQGMVVHVPQARPQRSHPVRKRNRTAQGPRPSAAGATSQDPNVEVVVERVPVGTIKVPVDSGKAGPGSSTPDTTPTDEPREAAGNKGSGSGAGAGTPTGGTGGSGAPPASQTSGSGPTG